MKVAKRMGFNLIHLEVEAINVLSAISSKDNRLAPIHLVYACIFYLLSYLDGFQCSFVRRCGNTLAHMVARWDTGASHEKICMATFPDCLLTLEELNLS